MSTCTSCGRHAERLIHWIGAGCPGSRLCQACDGQRLAELEALEAPPALIFGDKP